LVAEDFHSVVCYEFVPQGQTPN